MNESEGKKGERASRRVTINIIGNGGGGGGAVEKMIYAHNEKKEKFRYYRMFYNLYDLTDEIDQRIDRIKEKVDDDELVPFPRVPRPIFGTGKTPLVAELIAGLDMGKNEIDKMGRSSADILFSTFGGGTGSGTLPTMIQRLREQGSIINFVFGILTHQTTDEHVNHIYTFPKINKSADLVILFENKRKSPEFINRWIVDLFDMLISSRNLNKARSPQDFRNYRDHVISSCPEEHDRGIRWLVPFVWPFDGGYEKKYKENGEFIPLLKFIHRALVYGCLCRIDKEDIKKCKSGILLVKAPKRYIDDLEEGEYEEQELPFGEKKEEKKSELLLDKLGELLNITKGNILHSFIEDEEGIKVILLLYGMPFKKLRELSPHRKIK